MLVIQSKKTDYNTLNFKKSFYHDYSSNYITTQEFNKLIAKNFASSSAQANLEKQK